MRAAPWITLGVIAALLLGGLWQLEPYAELAASLRGHPLAERGRVASDPIQNFTARAGRVALRDRPQAPSSTLGEVWRWCFEVSRRLPPDARVWLGVPSTSLYYYASFFWFPARVDATPEPAVIRDQRSLLQHARTPETGWLLRRGYTHLVRVGPRGLQLVELPTQAP